MSNRIFVGNLASVTDESTLRRACEDGGRRVSRVTIVTDRLTGRPRGFGFVEFLTDADARAAIGALRDRSIDGRTLTVFAVPDDVRRRTRRL
jgi:RNA recognition motif-containing protein